MQQPQPLIDLKKVLTTMNQHNALFRLSPVALSCLSALAVLTVLPAAAQTAPDAGQLLREQTAPALQAPRPAAGLRVITPPAEPTLPGGAQVTLQSVSINGNSVLTQEQLLAAVGPVAGQAFDMAGLRGLAERVAEAYHQAGYPFARAFLPQQQLTSGKLVIEVVEGRYGEVKATGDAELAPQAQGFLARLRSGDVIASQALERATLILDDQPGISSAPLIRPGQAFGTGDLEVEVQRREPFKASVGYDNHGNRYTGEHRLRANAEWNSPFMLGDQVQLSAVTTSEQLWLASVGYSLPLGGDGWRANVGYAHTSYELGKEFANANAEGSAKVTTAGVSYPVLRSQAKNLTLGLGAQHKSLKDQQGTDPVLSSKKSSTSWPLSAQFDARDGLWGGGITFGSVVWTHGRLKLDQALTDADERSGVNSRGSFRKWNLDVARLQATPVQGVTLYGRYSAQWASKQLDSSERFGLGGAGAVRAYSSGEGFGNEGWVVQLEARYQMGAYSPYAFYDQGSAKIEAPTNYKRSIAGAGVGTRWQMGPWSADAALAWRTKGGQPEDANTKRNPRLWVTAAYAF